MQHLSKMLRLWVSVWVSIVCLIGPGLKEVYAKDSLYHYKTKASSYASTAPIKLWKKASVTVLYDQNVPDWYNSIGRLVACLIGFLATLLLAYPLCITRLKNTIVNAPLWMVRRSKFLFSHLIYRRHEVISKRQSVPIINAYKKIKQCHHPDSLTAVEGIVTTECYQALTNNIQLYQTSGFSRVIAIKNIRKVVEIVNAFQTRLLQVEVDLQDIEGGWTEINSVICDQLSEATGWCVLDFQLEGYSAEADFALQMTLSNGE